MTEGLNEQKPAEVLNVTFDQISVADLQNSKGMKRRTIPGLTPGKVYSVWAVETEGVPSPEEFDILSGLLKRAADPETAGSMAAEEMTIIMQMLGRLNISSMESIFVVVPQNVDKHTANLHLSAHMRYDKVIENEPEPEA